MKQILKKLQNSNQILITSHAIPDGDAVGSLVATGMALEASGKKVTLYNESEIPSTYQFLPSIDQIKHKIDDIDVYDAVVVLDCGDIERVGEKASKISRISCVINIDHHITNTRFGNLQLIDPFACATCEIVYRLIKEINVPISTDIALCLYTGILTDTGSFRFSNTNREAFQICEEMVGIGVNPYAVARQVYQTYSQQHLKLLNMINDSSEISKNGKMSVMTLSQEMLMKTGMQMEDCNGISNNLKNIKNVKVAALILEQKNSVDANTQDLVSFHVSLRSDGAIDVAAIAAYYGGGGHASAAGFSITSTLSDVKKEMFTLAEKF